MKVLFTSIGTTGHIHPSIPYAIATRDAGHDVAFATPPAGTAAVTALGLPAFAVGLDRGPNEALRLAGVSDESLTVEEQLRLMTRFWTLGDHQLDRIRDLVDLGSRWRADLIVRGELEFGGCVAAERLGIPHASIKAFAYRDYRDIPDRVIVLAERLNCFREQVGLPPDPGLVMPYRYLDLWPFPRSFRVGPYPSPTCRPTGPVPFDQSGAETLPAWIDELPHREQVPRVYVTLGTAGSPERRAGAFAPLLAGLRDEPLSVIATVNRDVDPARFGPQPANVHLEQYIPQTLLLPYCDLVVCHGGSGTVISALGHGVPQVIVPFHADQPDNARAGAAAGYAIVVPPNELTPDSIRSAVRNLLDDPTYRTNARRIQAEIHDMPGPEQVVSWFERLARERVPADGWS